MEPMKPDTIESRLQWMRIHGWSVAIHNDYKLNGNGYSFWLFTKGGASSGYYVKGEGRDGDKLIIDQCINEIKRMEKQGFLKSQ